MVGEAKSNKKTFGGHSVGVYVNTGWALDCFNGATVMPI